MNARNTSFDRVAALYDLHGNLPALETILGECEAAGVELLVVGGDVFPGPLARESLALLCRQALPCLFLRGNGENDVLAARSGGLLTRVPEPYRAPLEWHARELSDSEAGWISSWPATLEIELAGLGRVLFCHATPRDDDELFTEVTPVAQLAPVFRNVDAPVVVCGHTHMPFDRRVEATRVVNAGSAGLPFGRSGADWLLLGPQVELRHTDFDLELALARLRRSAYPRFELVEQWLRSPPPKREMIELYERAAVR